MIFRRSKRDSLSLLLAYLANGKPVRRELLRSQFSNYVIKQAVDLKKIEFCYIFGHSWYVLKS